MRFIAENFGPIECVDIKLRDLNVFTGKNSTGKSYLAYLIWSLLAVEPDWEKLRNLFEEYLPNELISEIAKKDKELHEKIERKQFDFKSYVDEPHEISDEIAKKVKTLILEIFRRFDEIWGRNLEELIKDTFLVDNLGELVKTGKEKSRIVVCNDDCTMRISIEMCKDGLTSRVDDTVLKEVEENLFVTIFFGEPMLPTLYYKDATHDEFFTENYQIAGIIPVIFSWIFNGYFPYTSTFIAPDGRDGLIRSREAYIHALLSKEALLGKRVVMNEVDRRFMRFLESLYPTIKNKKISQLANFLEKKLGVNYILQREPPRYLLSIKGLEVPIQRAPSSYRELAPLVYAMRYGLDDGFVMIIEEPEAHLHPDAQVIAMRTLAGLSKSVDVILITHSINNRRNKQSVKSKESLSR